VSRHARRRFVLAHGFTQTARSWDTIGELLASRCPQADIRAIDLPGHGASSDLRGDLWRSARHLVDNGGRGTYVGYSMGGRVALHAALVDPHSVEQLVLIGATAGIDDAAERAARRESDERLAEHIEAIGVEAFVDEWLDNPLFAGLTSADALRDDRLRNTAEGLAASLRSTGTGSQEPMWGRLADIGCPTLVLAGERDTKFTQLGRRLAATLPHADLVVVPGVGHSVHLEAPAATVDAIIGWLGTDP
jgi:2-succinyl-6-hydroxy-2,4-cyclohexadiene-1-carboxylate synthase